jgi:hypothetical protein
LVAVRALLSIAAIGLVGLLVAGCGGSEDTLESLAGTPAAVHIVNDVETMAQSCKGKSAEARKKGLKAYTGLAQITAIHPEATFGPEGTDVTMKQLLRRTVEKTGHCFGVSVDAKGGFHVE